MQQRQPWQLSAAELGDRFAGGLLTPSEVLESVIERSAAVNPLLNLFASLDLEGARIAAAESDARWRSGNQIGPLDGVPVTIKDCINVAGMATAWGTSLFKDRIAERDETPVARLRAAGCVILGKTNIPELAIGEGNTDTPTFGVTRNPWNPERTPGSSSGGAAAAVAAGVAPIALGTDGGGSIRRPASYCGVLGLKTSTGFVGHLHGLPSAVTGLGTTGPLTRTVDDMALALRAIQGPVSGDRLSEAVAPRREEPASAGRLRIGYFSRFGAITAEPAVMEVCAKAVEHMSALGHSITEIEAPFDFPLLVRSIRALTDAGLAWILRDVDWRGHIAERFNSRIDSGAQLGAVDYVEAQRAVELIYEQIATAFDTFDLLMTPTASTLPWAADRGGPPHFSPFTGFVNAAGLPGLSIPCGFSSDGLPVGFQVVGPLGMDWLLVAVARAYERAYPWAHLWPKV